MTGARTVGRLAERAEGLVRWALACPLFVKVWVASALLVLAGALLGAWLALRWGDASVSRLSLSLLLLAGGVGLGGLLNYLLLRAAFQPFRILGRVAEDLRWGRVRLPLPRPLFTDPTVEDLLRALEGLLTEVEAYRQRVGDLSLRATERLETERLNLARELHDDIAQRLSALLVSLRLAQEGQATAVSHLEQSRELARSVLEAVRRLSRGLHPGVLDREGLASALRWYIEEVMAPVLPPTDLHLEEVPEHLPPPVEVCLFRIAQEALGNVARHSRARRAWVRLRSEEGWVVLEVGDDGVGFDPQRMWADPRGHLGLFTMQERARLVGGTLELHSAPGQGTRVVARIPLRAEGRG